MKAIIHCHSNYSFDSIVKIDSILDFCLKHEVQVLILSDHDTVQGSLSATKAIRARRLNIISPPAAEYKTEFGDVILVGLPYDLKNHNFEDLVKIAQENDCKLLFPHPYHDHTNIEYIASRVDFIEVFNSRCSFLENNKALELAKSIKISTYASPDAHLLHEYKNCIVEYDVNDNSNWYEVMKHDWSHHTKVSASFCDIYKSSLIKSLKTRSIVNFIKSFIKICIFCFIKKRDKSSAYDTKLH